MRTPSRTDSAPSTLGVSGRESSKSIYISNLVDYSTRSPRGPFDGDEHIDDAEGQRDCTHGAKAGVPKLLRKLFRRGECFDRFGQVIVGARMLRDDAADERQNLPEIPAGRNCEAPTSAAVKIPESRACRRDEAPAQFRGTPRRAVRRCECRSRSSSHRPSHRAAECAWHRRGRDRWRWSAGRRPANFRRFRSAASPRRNPRRRRAWRDADRSWPQEPDRPCPCRDRAQFRVRSAAARRSPRLRHRLSSPALRR